MIFTKNEGAGMNGTPVGSPHVVARVLFASVWWANGLLCKVLGMVPRHQEIVARILGEAHAHGMTLLIGAAEVLFGCWIFSGWKWRWSAALQVAGVLLMNVIEFFLARDLLLFGGWNAAIALAYCAVVMYSGVNRAKCP